MITLENQRGSILIVDSKKEINLTLTRILEKEGHWVGSSHNFTEAMEILREKGIDVILATIETANMDGMVLLKEIKKIKPGIQVIMIADDGNINSYLEAMKLGAFEYFNKPIKNRILCKVIEKAMGYF